MKLISTIYSDYIPSSFVKKALKFTSDTGNGEAKLYLNDNYSAKQYISFFNNYDLSNLYFVNRDSILDYLNKPAIKEAFIENPKTKIYKTINESWYNKMKSIISSYPNKHIPLSFESRLDCDDQCRYYIRSYDAIFREHLRSITLPKTTYISIERIIIEPTDELNLDAGTIIYVLNLV